MLKDSELVINLIRGKEKPIYIWLALPTHLIVCSIESAEGIANELLRLIAEYRENENSNGNT